MCRHPVGATVRGQWLHQGAEETEARRLNVPQVLTKSSNEWFNFRIRVSTAMHVHACAIGNVDNHNDNNSPSPSHQRSRSWTSAHPAISPRHQRKRMCPWLDLHMISAAWAAFRWSKKWPLRFKKWETRDDIDAMHEHFINHSTANLHFCVLYNRDACKTCNEPLLIRR